MRIRGLEEEQQVETWVRSIRLVLLMNGVTAALGLAQVLLTWTVAQRGAVLPMLVIGLALPAMVRLLWRRVAEHR